MTTITCKIPKKFAAELEKLARAEGRSQSALLREALEQRVKATRQGRSTRAYDLVKHLVGSLHGSAEDLATNSVHTKGFGE